MPGVQRDQPNGISVLISGAGVGGIMVALECWRKGCDVRIFERTKSSTTAGDGFNIGQSALRSFKNYPEMEQKSREIAYEPMIAVHNHKGELQAGPLDAKLLNSPAVDDSKMPERMPAFTRPKFHHMLLEQLEKIGVKIEFDKAVVDYYENSERRQGGVVLKDGSKHEADIVVAADGFRTASYGAVRGEPAPAQNSGHASFRVAYPVERILDDPMVTERFKMAEDNRSILEMWIGPNMYATFWRTEDVMIWGVNHPIDTTESEPKMRHVEPDDVLAYTSTVPGWPEVADRVIKATPPGTLIDWPLLWRDPQPHCASTGGHVVQIGDAAHTFLPSSGNGGTQAIEDALSLAACISLAGKENIANASHVHNLLRFERVSLLQALGVSNRENRTSDQAKAQGKNPLPSYGAWIIEHDPEQYAIENYEKAVAHVTKGEPFKNTNIPKGVDYEPWTIDGLVKALENGEPTILDGDWS